MQADREQEAWDLAEDFNGQLAHRNTRVAITALGILLASGFRQLAPSDRQPAFDKLRRLIFDTEVH